MQLTQNTRYEICRLLDCTQLGAQHVATWFRPTCSGGRPSSGRNDTKVGDLGGWRPKSDGLHLGITTSTSGKTSAVEWHRSRLTSQHSNAMDSTRSTYPIAKWTWCAVNVRWYIKSVISSGSSSIPCNTQPKVSLTTHPIIHVAITYMSVLTLLINLFSLYCPSYPTV